MRLLSWRPFSSWQVKPKRTTAIFGFLKGPHNPPSGHHSCPGQSSQVLEQLLFSGILEAVWRPDFCGQRSNCSCQRVCKEPSPMIGFFCLLFEGRLVFGWQGSNGIARGADSTEGIRIEIILRGLSEEACRSAKWKQHMGLFDPSLEANKGAGHFAGGIVCLA